MNIRRITLILAICGLVVAGLSQNAQAQQRMSRRGAHRGLRTAEVQDKASHQRQEAFAALDLTETQRGELDALRQTIRTRIQELRQSGQRPTREQIRQMRAERQAELDKILTPEQSAKLQELRAEAHPRIARGNRGHRGPGDRPLMDRLGLTDTQQSQLSALRQTARARMQELRESGQRPTREQIQQMRADYRARFESILSPEQLARLQQLRASRRPAGATRQTASEETTGTAKAVTGAGVQQSTWGTVKRSRQ